ncbi:MAG: Protein translocase subunit SecF [Legionellaceae bacterium]
MEFFKKQTAIDFMGLRKWSAIFSLLLFFASTFSLIKNSLTWGLDFTGGTQAQLHYQSSANLSTIREQLVKANFDKAIVQSYGSSEDALVSLPPSPTLSQQALKEKLLTALPGAELQRIESVGPEVGQELATKGGLAILVALLGIVLYISMRFEYRLAISAVLALIHDPILILGVFSHYHIEFNLTALAALLAVLGYSLNDTIVIFDRVRENFRKIRKSTPIEIMNLSINQTLSRTIMTSVITLIVVTALFIYGGEMIHNFSLALIIGIIIGTYSSIYVAGALAIALGLNKKDLMPTPKKAIDDRP